MKKSKFLLILAVLVLILIACSKSTSKQYNVDGSSCNSCGNCIQVCPADAIEFDKNNKAIIDQTKCTQCGNCAQACPKDAIY